MVYHSQSGGTEVMAAAVINGVTDPEIQGVELRIRNPLEATAEDVLWAEAVIIGNNEKLG